jgi:hypothetical protein
MAVAAYGNVQLSLAVREIWTSQVQQNLSLVASRCKSGKLQNLQSSKLCRLQMVKSSTAAASSLQLRLSYLGWMQNRQVGQVDSEKA